MRNNPRGIQWANFTILQRRKAAEKHFRNRRIDPRCGYRKEGKTGRVVFVILGQFVGWKSSFEGNVSDSSCNKFRQVFQSTYIHADALSADTTWFRVPYLFTSVSKYTGDNMFAFTWVLTDRSIKPIPELVGCFRVYPTWLVYHSNGALLSWPMHPTTQRPK